MKMSTFYSHYVPSHMSIHGNEIIDQLAKEAAIPFPLYNLVSKDTETFFTSLSELVWQKKWPQNPSKLLMHKKSMSMWNQLQTLSIESK